MPAKKATKGSSIDIFAPIDISHLIDSIALNGMFRMRHPQFRYTVRIDVLKCLCADENCEEVRVDVWRESGVFSIYWQLSGEELQGYGTLQAFYLSVVAGALEDSYGERLLIEEQATKVFQTDLENIDAQFCVCESCAQKYEENDLWERTILSQLASALVARKDAVDEALAESSEEKAILISEAFDLGYSAGRIFSELSVKKFIESDALAGRAAAEVISKRAKAAGDRSARSREERRRHLFEKLQILIQKNPDLGRMPIEMTGKLAMQDAAREKPTLWSQGAGQFQEYLGEIRRGEAGPELRARFDAIFS